MSNWLTREITSAIVDARQRIVERGWFGEVVTPRATSITIGSPGSKSPGEGLGWFDRNFSDADPARQSNGPDRDIHGNERGHGMER